MSLSSRSTFTITITHVVLLLIFGMIYTFIHVSGWQRNFSLGKETYMYNRTEEQTKKCNVYVPKDKHHYGAVFHDMDMILSSFCQFQKQNISIQECDDIILTVSAQYDYQHTTLNGRNTDQIFTFNIINHSDFETQWKHNKCNGQPYPQDQMLQFREFLIKKFKLTNSYNMDYKLQFYRKHGDVLIIDRRTTRRILNIKELYQGVCDLYPNRTKLVYFEDISLLEQYHHVLNASIIITPHGAAEHSLMVWPFELSKKDVYNEFNKLIELCPPYTHCPWNCHRVIWRYKANLCPMAYQNTFRSLNFSFYGIAREDVHWNCSQYCWYHHLSPHKRQINLEFLHIIFFKVNVQSVVDALNYHQRSSGSMHFIHADQFDTKEYAFYRSTAGRGQYVDLFAE
eukprot:1051888_1